MLRAECLSTEFCSVCKKGFPHHVSICSWNTEGFPHWVSWCITIRRAKQNVIAFAELVDTYVATHSTDAKFLEDRAAAGNTEVNAFCASSKSSD